MKQKELKSFISINEINIKDLLKDFIRINSIYDPRTVTEFQPYGKGVNEIFVEITKAAKKLGFIVKNFKGHVITISAREISDDEEYIGVLCHGDTVSINPDDWKFDAFTPTEKDGFILGRGTQDDKGPLVSILYALKYLKDNKLLQGLPIKILVGGNEERGASAMELFLKHNKHPIASFTPDNQFPIVNSEKSSIEFKYTFDLKDKDIISLQAGHTINIVPDKANLVTTNKREFIDVFEKFIKENSFVGDYKIQDNKIHFFFKGVAAHGSVPTKGVNALYNSLLFINKIKPNEVIDIILYNLFRQNTWKELGCKHDEKFGDLTFNTSLCKTNKKGLLEISTDIRVPLDIPFDILQKSLTKKLSPLKVEVPFESIGLYMAEDTPLVSILLGVYREVTNDMSAPIASGASTYAQELDNCLAFGGLFPDSEFTMHETNESLSIKDLFRQILVYVPALQKLCMHEWKKIKKGTLYDKTNNWTIKRCG